MTIFKNIATVVMTDYYQDEHMAGLVIFSVTTSALFHHVGLILEIVILPAILIVS